MKLQPASSVLLDLIRGVSAQLVVIGHLLSFYKVYGYKEDSGQFIIQNFGVVVFFILSGFLIAYSVNGKNPDYGFKEYFIDRASRIFIAFLPALVVIALLDFSSAALLTEDKYPQLRRALKRKFLSKSVARQMAMQPEG